MGRRCLALVRSPGIGSRNVSSEKLAVTVITGAPFELHTDIASSLRVTTIECYRTVRQ